MHTLAHTNMMRHTCTHREERARATRERERGQEGLKRIPGWETSLGWAWASWWEMAWGSAIATLDQSSVRLLLRTYIHTLAHDSMRARPSAYHTHGQTINECLRARAGMAGVHTCHHTHTCVLLRQEHTAAASHTESRAWPRLARARNAYHKSSKPCLSSVCALACACRHTHTHTHTHTCERARPVYVPG